MGRLGQIVGVAVLLALMALPSMVAAGPVSAEARGYRLRGYRWDAVLGQRWAVFENAGHPERPLVSEMDRDGGAGPISAGPLPAAQSGPKSGPKSGPLKVAELVVHPGDAVTLWRDEGNVRMQFAAVAEGNGGVGQEVQLRVTGAGIFGSSGWRAAGVVRGAGSVEME